MFIVRAALPSDLEDLYSVSEHLDSVNLPSDRGELRRILRRSERSFAGTIEPARREFSFAIQTPGPSPAGDGTRPTVIGSSMIFAQHGTRRAPHVYFDVIEEERYSETLDSHFHHLLLRIGYNYKGVTEVGGLALLPSYRRHAEHLGHTLSMVRFMYMGLHRELFKDEVIAELMPPLEDDGRSLLWEALGRRFTNLSYQDADRLSRENKEFIKALFPQSAIYAALLAPEAQALIGQVGPATKGVERMLTAIGFTYAQRIDPFDGGPHFSAATDEIAPLRALQRARLHGAMTAPAPTAIAAIVAREQPDAPYFLAVRTRVTLEGDSAALLPEARDALQAQTGDSLAVLPL